MDSRPKKLLYVVNVPAFFISHRISIALRALKQGWHVVLITGMDASKIMEVDSAHVIDSTGIMHFKVHFRSAGMNPFRETLGLFQLILRTFLLRPYIVHCVSPKGNLYGGLAARIARVPKLVIAVSGMGFLFTGKSGVLKVTAGKIYLSLMRWILRHPNCTAIVQNEDDRKLLIANGLSRPEDVVLIPGSGVDLAAFKPLVHTKTSPVVLFPARILADKGIREFVEAARILKMSGVEWNFVLAGATDYENPTAISTSEVEEWQDRGWIEWRGYQKNMLPLFQEAAIVCLPSYREGMPKALLEAAAAGRPVVTTDVQGCRDAVIPDKTGLLVPVKDAIALSRALRKLIEDGDLRRSMGMAGRDFAEEMFDINDVIDKTLEIYSEGFK